MQPCRRREQHGPTGRGRRGGWGGILRNDDRARGGEGVGGGGVEGGGGRVATPKAHEPRQQRRAVWARLRNTGRPRRGRAVGPRAGCGGPPKKDEHGQAPAPPARPHAAAVAPTSGGAGVATPPPPPRRWRRVRSVGRHRQAGRQARNGGTPVPPRPTLPTHTPPHEQSHPPRRGTPRYVRAPLPSRSTTPRGRTGPAACPCSSSSSPP